MIKPYLNNEDRGKYKASMVENNHHIFPRSLGGTDNPNNIIRLYEDLHNARHRVTGTLLIKPSLEQIMALNAPALTVEFKRDIMKVLQEDDLQYYYKREVYR